MRDDASWCRTCAAGVIELAYPDGRRDRIRVRRADGFIGRLRGLIGQPLPAPATGLWIEPCASVHTFGMCGALDLVFVSICMVVLRVEAAIPPRRVRGAAGARAVLELRAGEAARLGLRAGMRLAWAATASAREHCLAHDSIVHTFDGEIR